MYPKTVPGWLKHWDFELLDLLGLQFAFFLSYWTRHKSYVAVGSWNNRTAMSDMYLRTALILLVFHVLSTLINHPYRGIIQRDATQEMLSVVRHVSTVLLLLLLYEYWIQEADRFSRAVYALTWALGIFFMFGGRLIWKKVLRRYLANEKRQRKLLLVSAEGRVCRSVRSLRQKRYREFKICAIAVPEARGRELREDYDVPVLYGTSTLYEYIRGNVVDEVLIDAFQKQEHLKEWIDTFLAMGVTVHIGMGFLPDELPFQTMEQIGEEYVVTSAIHATSSLHLAVKRFMDILGALPGLLLTGAAFVVVAPLIKKASPGPVFFRQERIGKNGRIFRIYKFRSMHVGADAKKQALMDQNEMEGLMFKMENDPRIIGSEKGNGRGIGNFIRRTSIDELPQFWNVLKGDMSLVGTRPPTVDEYERYELKHKIRLSMKPGITGLSQVRGRSRIKDFNEVVRLDTEYIKHWSIQLDIQILLQTIKVVLTGEGAV